MVRFDDGFADRQSEPAVPFAARSRFVHTIKSFKDVRQVTGLDARAGIANDEDALGLFRPRGNEHLTALPIIVNRIGQQIGEVDSLRWNRLTRTVEVLWFQVRWCRVRRGAIHAIA